MNDEREHILHLCMQKKCKHDLLGLGVIIGPAVPGYVVLIRLGSLMPMF